MLLCLGEINTSSLFTTSLLQFIRAAKTVQDIWITWMRRKTIWRVLTGLILMFSLNYVHKILKYFMFLQSPYLLFWKAICCRPHRSTSLYLITWVMSKENPWHNKTWAFILSLKWFIDLKYFILPNSSLQSRKSLQKINMHVICFQKSISKCTWVLFSIIAVICHWVFGM